MSRIDKLQIVGVRSFDNARSETIQFQTPLTLIVGANGSGKTTIIECLKYATAGELPPNSKGGAWIHDPNLCHDKEVLAQVKISFRSTEGHRMVCTRNLLLTVKKNARSVKTAESNITMSKHGDRTTISSRVAEINDIMPRYLGVSKAVLDSVVFCHQDESLWPLSAPKDLKERFDQIFEAQKYSKAIDNIKVLKKGQNEKLIAYKKDEEHGRVNKDRAVKSKERMELLDDQAGELRAQSEEFSKQIQEATQAAEHAWSLSEEAGKIVNELNGKRIVERTKEESVQSLRQNLNEMSESDQELSHMLEDYEDRVQTHQDELSGSKERYNEVNKEINNQRAKVTAKEREAGSYEGQQQSYERQLANRETLVKETARSHNIRGFDLEIDDGQVTAFMDRIAKMARDQNAAFEKARRETSEELQRAQKAITTINEKKSALNSRKESAKQAIGVNDRKMGSLQKDLDKIDIDEGRMASMDSILLDTKSRLQNAKTGLEGAKWESQVNEAETQTARLDERKEKLDTELVEGTRQVGDTARLDHLHKELKEGQQSLDTMSATHGTKIASIIGKQMDPASVEEDFHRAVQQRDSEVNEAVKQQDGVSRELEQLDYKWKTVRTELANKRAEVNSAVEAIEEAANCPPHEYEKELQELEDNYKDNKSHQDSSFLIRKYLNECIETCDRHNGCRTCQRSFGNDQEKQKMRQYVSKQLAKFQESDVKVIEELEEELKKARSVGPRFDAWERLSQKDIPALEKEDARLGAKRNDLNDELERHDTRVEELRSAKRDVEGMSRTVQTIAKYCNDIRSYQSQITELEANQQAAGLSRGLEAIQDDIKKINEESRTVRARLSKITTERDRARDNINRLELEVSKLNGKLSEADYQLRSRRSLEGQIDELKSTNSSQRDSIRSADQETQELGPQLAQAQAKYDEIARIGAEKDRTLQADTSKLNNSLNQLRMASKEIQDYLDRGGPDQLKRARREIDTLQSAITRLEKELSEAVRVVKRLEDTLRNHAETRRSISDNQRYRRDLRTLQEIRREIASLETSNAEAEKSRHENEGHKNQLIRNKLASEQASVIGQLKQTDMQLKQLIEDYDTEYAHAARTYKLAHINVETTKACIEDLTRYGGALDKAIMKFHSLKMEEINRIVDELWRKTYQGTDVDTILIRSESESARANKSYNYRVCMIKSDAEMDMRGRCSAGQRVLASIIIRLALAECFGVSCGLIALDEPTTNLDKENIKALAGSLAEIIRVRRQQSNFQLIVITHDEEFLREMGAADFADEYWRVSRNEGQKSVIEKQSIAEVL